MKALIAYSRCQHTRKALEAVGVEAWTCDLLPVEGEGGGRHLQCDVREVAEDAWSFGIFHPMCTYLTNSAAWAFKDPDFERWPDCGYHQSVRPGTLTGEQRRRARAEAIEEVRWLLSLPYPKAVENPARGALSAAIRPPDQVVHPYMFGDDASKATGLWLDRLPPLVVPPREYWVRPRMVNRLPRWANQTDGGQNRATPSATRWLERSATYPGIARAFAQWPAMLRGEPLRVSGLLL